MVGRALLERSGALGQRMVQGRVATSSNAANHPASLHGEAASKHQAEHNPNKQGRGEPLAEKETSKATRYTCAQARAASIHAYCTRRRHNGHLVAQDAVHNHIDVCHTSRPPDILPAHHVTAMGRQGTGAQAGQGSAASSLKVIAIIVAAALVFSLAATFTHQVGANEGAEGVFAAVASCHRQLGRGR